MTVCTDGKSNRGRPLLWLVALLLCACSDNTANVARNEPGDIARQVVADFLSLPFHDVALVSLDARDFNDSSLDCPEPGMSYQQVITAGHQAIVEADGRRFDIRVAGGYGRICHKSKKKPGTLPSRESAITSMVDAARSDLAEKLDAAANQVIVTDVRPDSVDLRPVGCMPDCSGADPCGYLIGLSYERRRYDYHASDGEIAACPAISRL